MSDEQRITLDEVAERLGVGVRTAEKYRSTIYIPGGREPTFPGPDLDGTYDPDEVDTWNTARKGAGRPEGSAPAGKACDSCGEVVPRRSKDEAADGSEVLVCLPCLKQDGAPYKQAGWTAAAV